MALSLVKYAIFFVPSTTTHAPSRREDARRPRTLSGPPALGASHFRTENTHPFLKLPPRARPVARRYVKSRSFYAPLTRRRVRSNRGTRVGSRTRSFVASSCARDIRDRSEIALAMRLTRRARGVHPRVGAKLGGDARAKIVFVDRETFDPRGVVATDRLTGKDGRTPGRRPRTNLAAALLGLTPPDRMGKQTDIWMDGCL